MRYAKDVKRFAQMLKPYGLTISQTKTHYAIKDQEGHRLGTLSISPSDSYFIKSTVRQLVQTGALPPEAKNRF